jgi:hypothetical protein
MSLLLLIVELAAMTEDSDRETFAFLLQDFISETDSSVKTPYYYFY